MPSSRRSPPPPADLPEDDGPTSAEVAAQARAQRGAAKLAGEAKAALLDLLQAAHADRGGDIPGLAYKTLRGVRRPVLETVDGGLAALVPLLSPATPDRDALRTALNDVLGDHLARIASPLAIAMTLRHAGLALVPRREALAAVLPASADRLLLHVGGPGLDDPAWGQAEGFVPVHLDYNRGLHVSTNARALAGQLERLLAHWPQPLARFAIVAHGTGGLVARGALHYGRAAGHHWAHRLDDLVFLGTPHHGALLTGDATQALFASTPQPATFARLASLHGAGLADLAHGNVVDEDWRAGDRAAGAADRRVVLPLPAGPRCFAIAGSLDADGDGVVPLASALGRHRLARRTLAFPPDRQHVAEGVGHLQLPASPAVREQLARWLGS